MNTSKKNQSRQTTPQVLFTNSVFPFPETVPCPTSLIYQRKPSIPFLPSNQGTKPFRLPAALPLTGSAFEVEPDNSATPNQRSADARQGDPPNEATDGLNISITQSATSLRIPASSHSAEPVTGSALLDRSSGYTRWLQRVSFFNCARTSPIPCVLTAVGNADPIVNGG